MNRFTALEKYPQKAVKMFTQVLSSFAPHITEEAWEHFGENESISYAPYPEVDPKYLQDQTALCVVQVNGKLRGKWLFPRDQTQEEVLAFIQTQPNIRKHVTGKIKKSDLHP